MLTRRVIVCLDVQGGRVVKGVQFVALRDVGDPVELAAAYEREGADEIVFLDISASAEGRDTLLDVARRTAERLFVPLTIGGGVRGAEDVGRVLRAGADKVSLNSAAVADPEIMTRSAERFGYPVTLVIDAAFGMVCLVALPLMARRREPDKTERADLPPAGVAAGSAVSS